MKTNEALEKIYLDEDESWHLTNPNGDSVEYTRTDAFIEKACEFMETYPHMFMGVMRTEMIEDFKKAMEEQL